MFFTQIFLGMLQNPIIDELNERYDEVAPFCFFYETNSEKSKKMSKVLREFYFPYEVLDNRTLSSLSHVSRFKFLKHYLKLPLDF